MSTSEVVDLTSDEISPQTIRKSFSRQGERRSHQSSNSRAFNPESQVRKSRSSPDSSPFNSFPTNSASTDIVQSGFDYHIQPSRVLVSGTRSTPLPSSRVGKSTDSVPLEGHTSRRRRVVSDAESTPSKRQRGSLIPEMDRLPGTHGYPIQVDDEDETLPSAIRHGNPNSQSGRSPAQSPDLLILGRRRATDEEEGCDSPTSVEFFDSDTNSTFTAGDYIVDDSDLPKIIEELSITDAACEARAFSCRVEVDQFKGHGFTCTVGKSVELRDGSFLRIESVARNDAGEHFVRGHLLVRQTTLAPTMPKTHNELVWIQPQDAANIDLSLETNLSEVPVSEIVQNRAITFTNQRYPAMSSQDNADRFPNVEQNYHLGPLFCRWKREVFYNAQNRVISEAFSHLMYKHADNKPMSGKAGQEILSRIADPRNRSIWRGCVTKRGGSHFKPVVDIEGAGDIHKVQQYTFGDGFCGVGGTSRGALGAGLHVKWGFDYDLQAIESYEANFGPGGTDCRYEAVFEFLERVRQGGAIVDVLHLSPPCQPFSPAKTFRTPEQDEKNEAALFSVGELLQAVKPRVVTMEETYGLVSRHRDWFDALLHVFIYSGYSVRWTVMNLAEFGVPQKRRRLVVIAAGPGENLPPFPEPTHGPRSLSQKPFVTIDDCIEKIKDGTADHNLDTVHYFGQPNRRFSGNTLANTLTTSGGIGNYHPSGLRHYTVRENACLQTFPLCHKFIGGRGITAKKRQIGNAVPPAFAQALFKTITESLREDDEASVRMSKIGLVGW